MDTKSVFIFIIVAFWALTSHSQYSPVIENEAKWVIQKAELEFYFPQEIILGDTNADGSINLLYKYFVSGDFVPSGTVWQNSDNSKIWYSKTGSEADSVLIYDMNLNVGDTFYFIPNISYFSIVDSVYWESGLKIIRFIDQPNNFNEKYKFVEGVGPSFGLNYLLNNDTHMHFCTCKFNGDSLFWHTSLFPFQDCYSVNDVFSINEDGLFVYPNPSKGKFELSKDCNGDYYIILDEFGRIIKDGYVENNFINIEMIDTGIYIFSIKRAESWITIKIQII